MPPPSSEDRPLGPVGRAFSGGLCLLIGLPLLVVPWRDLGEDSLPLIAAVSLAGLLFVLWGLAVLLPEGRSHGRWVGWVAVLAGVGFYVLLVGALLLDRDDIDYSGGGRGPDGPGEAVVLGLLLLAPVVLGAWWLVRDRLRR